MITATAVQVAWIIGEREESSNFLTKEIRSLNYEHVYKGDEVFFLNSEDKGDPPDVIFVNIDLLKEPDLSEYVKYLYPDIPVIVLCEHDELLYALETVGGKADHYLIRGKGLYDEIEKAIRFASYRISRPDVHANLVKWFHTLIPQAILDIANVMFFVNYEDPDSQMNSQVRNAVARVFEDLDEEICKRLLNI